MVRLAALLLVTLLSSLTLLAQSNPPQPTMEVVSGNLQLPPGTPASNTIVRFQLSYCGGNNGRVTNPDGSVTIVSFAPFDLRTTNGTWSTNLYGSDQIQCGTQKGTSRWRITPIFNGTNGLTLDYQVQSCGATTGCTAFDIDAAPQCQGSIATNCVVQYPYVIPPPPPVVGPPGPEGPPGPPGSGGTNPGTHNQIAYYATDGSLVSGDPLFTDNGALLSYLGSGYVQNNFTIDQVEYIQGSWYVDTPVATSPMPAAPLGRSAIGTSNDGNFYVSANAGTPSKVCTAGNGACPTGLPASPLTGDTLRFNVNGDNAWDAVNAAHNWMAWNFIPGGSCPNGTFFVSGTLTSGGAAQAGMVCTTVNGTNTLPNGMTYSSNASAYALTAIGLNAPSNGNNSLLPIRAWYRMTFRLSISPVANTRYWFGLTTFNVNAGFAGTNNAAINNSSKYFTDTPNSNTIGFRWSAGTDTHWQAVAITAGGSSTFVDTGITPDTSPHAFGVAMNATGTALTYLIDNVQVATISTNIPPASGTTSPQDALASLFMNGDNKNTATACAVTMYSIHLSLR